MDIHLVIEIETVKSLIKKSTTSTLSTEEARKIEDIIDKIEAGNKRLVNFKNKMVSCLNDITCQFEELGDEITVLENEIEGLDI